MSDPLDIFAYEPLDDELAPYLSAGKIGTVLHHPLIISVMHVDMLNKHTNLRFKTVKKHLATAIAEKNWSSAVFLHERPYRMDALFKIMGDAGWKKPSERTPEFWELVGSIWIDSENVFQHFDQWHKIWAASLGGHQVIMDEDEQRALAEMPDTIEVWRGGGYKNVKKGLSWTIDRDKAVWFAKRFNKKFHLAHGMVAKKDVIIYLTGRGEKELVVLPKNVKDVSVEIIAP